jgi:hypothetical protein
MKKLFTLVFMLTTYFVSAQSVIYVNASTGSDSNDGLSATVSGDSGPKQTLSGIDGALSIVTEGDIVSVASGTYTEDVVFDKSVVLIKTGFTSAAFNSITFDGGAQLIAPKPAPNAFSAPIVTINSGSSISDGANLVATDGTVFLQQGTYDETLTLTHSFELVSNGSIIRDVVLAGTGIEVIATGSIAISGSLQLNRPEGGYLVLSNSDIRVLTGASVFPGNANSYVKTTGLGILSIPATSSTIIPVGTEDVYAPITISDFTPSDISYFSGRVRSASNPLSFNPDLGTQVNSHIRLEWTMDSSSPISNATVRFDYTGVVEPSDWTTVANRVVAEYTSGGSWTEGTNITIGEAYSTAKFTSINGVFAIYSDFPNAIADLSSTSISAFPTPFNDQVNLSLSCSSTDLVQIQLIDVAGRIVSQKQAVLNSGMNNIQLNDLNAFQPGIYLIKVQGSSVETTIRTMKF